MEGHGVIWTKRTSDERDTISVTIRSGSCCLSCPTAGPCKRSDRTLASERSVKGRENGEAMDSRGIFVGHTPEADFDSQAWSLRISRARLPGLSRPGVMEWGRAVPLSSSAHTTNFPSPPNCYGRAECAARLCASSSRVPMAVGQTADGSAPTACLFSHKPLQSSMT
jgi:hypothetical protein